MQKKKYKQLSDNERDRIGILLRQGYRVVEIAEAVDRHKSTISREIKRNRRKIRTRSRTFDGDYESPVARQKAYVRKKYKKKDWKKINKDKTLRTYITDGLRKHWNPDEIAGRMRKERTPFYASKTAIYDWLRSSRGQYFCQYLYSERSTVKKRKKKAKRTLIPNRISIDERPVGATNRSRYGHFEEDTIVSGKRGFGALSVLYERKARYTDIRKLSSLKPDEHVRAIETMAENFTKVYSITFDNGIENTSHENLHTHGIDTFFCDPYASWQKGSVENVNKMIRRYIPKGTDISKIDVTTIKNIVMILNAKPRKSLNYKTPLEVMSKNGLLKINESVALAP